MLSCLYCGFFVFWLKLSPTWCDSWKAEIPRSVVGLEGSCLVIPCHFSYSSSNKKDSDLTGIWLTDSNEVVFHSKTSKINSMFQKRTSLLGDLSHGNCSLKISPLHHHDSGPFMFRIEIEHYNNYSFTRSKVSISVQDSPVHPSLFAGMEMKSGKKVTTSCSVSHSCPSDPPHITWNYQGTFNSQSQEQTKGQWKTTSSLSFTPSKMEHNKPLICTAVFPGGRRVSSQTTLNVKYPPEIVEVVSEPRTVMEGGAVVLSCSSDGNPAAHTYQWVTGSGTLLAVGRSYTLKSVSRHTESISCTAVNTEGSASSTAVQLNIVYPPEIKVGSSCTSDMSVVTCLCMVDSHPASDINWWSPDTSTELPKTNIERHGSLTIVTLQGSLGFSHTVRCSASNSMGNSTLTLQVPNSGKLTYILVAVSASLVAITGLSIWMLKGKCRTEQPTAQPKSEMNVIHSQADLGSKSIHSPPNCTESLYVYGNTVLVEEDDPYECAIGDDAIYANV